MKEKYVIIDFEKKGNVVRFYLGKKEPKWGWTNKDYKSNGKTPDWLKPSDRYYGDDWNDRPYEHNAGKVYNEFIKGHVDIAFNFDDLVLEPADGYTYNSAYCKDDMVDRRVPCIIVVPHEICKDSYNTDFDYWKAAKGLKAYYFGDEIEVEKENS